jgi:hypothetical protein
MHVVLGANATSGTLWFAAAVDATLTQYDPCQFQLPAGLRRPRALEAGRDEIAEMLARLAVDLVVLAEPEVSKQTYQSLVARMSVEGVLEFGAAKAGVELQRISRAKLRSVHNLGKPGSVSSHVSRVVAQPLAPHWVNKRDIAALAALACS